MIGRVLLFAALMMLVYPLGCTRALEPHEAGIVPPAPPIQDKAKEDACDCCQKCKAAKRNITSKNEEKATGETDGCEDCCGSCGKILQPAQPETPPEVIEKKVPDIKEKPQ